MAIGFICSVEFVFFVALAVPVGFAHTLRIAVPQGKEHIEQIVRAIIMVSGPDAYKVRVRYKVGKWPLGFRSREHTDISGQSVMPFNASHIEYSVGVGLCFKEGY